jgi:hypothetical protein
MTSRSSPSNGDGVARRAGTGPAEARGRRPRAENAPALYRAWLLKANALPPLPGGNPAGEGCSYRRLSRRVRASRRDASVGNRTNFGAMRSLAVAFRALLGVDDIGVALHANGGGGTVELASSANRALRRDDLQGHEILPACSMARRPRNGAARLDATDGGKQESFQFAAAARRTLSVAADRRAGRGRGPFETPHCS